jgi:hypothetical protein
MSATDVLQMYRTTERALAAYHSVRRFAMAYTESRDSRKLTEEHVRRFEAHMDKKDSGQDIVRGYLGRGWSAH